MKFLSVLFLASVPTCVAAEWYLLAGLHTVFAVGCVVVGCMSDKWVEEE